ncbi:hypothetical protein DERF_010710 [Dermatophagoides farinae]|uniref:Uncharacterized protein n=1 Tax=Dermatophagoides farinae TaxID=6954 RepID=A0A922HTI5_DERFA|nr:hypothetical protein DERF_010710 [Dermatophagoides farinae]
MNPTQQHCPDFIKSSKEEERESVNQTMPACSLTRGVVVETQKSLNFSSNNSGAMPNEEKKINASTTNTPVSAVVPKLEHQLPKTLIEFSRQFPDLYKMPNARNQLDNNDDDDDDDDDDYDYDDDYGYDYGYEDACSHDYEGGTDSD